ncbi:ABC transporter permease [Corynebacterium kalidii]
MPLSPELWRTLAAVAVLGTVAVTVLSVAWVPHRWGTAVAVARGTLQLALLSVVLTGVITDPVWVGVALAVMFTVAAVTATVRLGWSLPRFLVVSGAMGAGVTTVLAVVFLTGAVEFSPRYVLAVGGIVVGGAMSTATLAGRRLAQATDERWPEVEGWLALGATPRQATLDIARYAVREALVPSTDQTKTTGLVIAASLAPTLHRACD